jgi:hypothetical protein
MISIGCDINKSRYAPDHRLYTVPKPAHDLAMCSTAPNARPRIARPRYPLTPGRRRSRSWPGGHLREGACGGSSCAFDPAREGGEPWLRNDVDSRGAAKPVGFYGSDWQ